MRGVLVLALAIASSACVKDAVFECSSADQCSRAGVAGRCEPESYCSFPDSRCTTGYRFGDHAGAYSEQCVGDVGSDGGMSDDTLDGLGCPAGYGALPGVADRLYRKLPTAAGWTNHNTACTSEGANVHLAIPDDMTELTAIVTLAAADVWVGINDTSTEGTFVTVLGSPATFLPWASSEPDNSGNQDCVAVRQTSSLIETLGCGTTRIAICECAP